MDFNIDIAKEIFYKNAVLGKTYKELSEEYHLHHTTICKKMKQFKKEFQIDEQEKYCLHTYLRFFHGEEIKQKYLAGMSTIGIAKEYKTNDHLIADVLRDLNIEVRSTGVPSRTDQTLFSSINNEIDAYALGLITADGSIMSTYTIRTCLIETDKYVLEEINSRLLNGTGHFSIDKKERKHPLARLDFNGKQICENLSQYNVIPNKADFLTEVCIFPDELMPHYIRGLFDGNGVAAKSNGSVRVGFCAKREEFVKSYQSFLCQKLYMRKNKIFNTGGCFQCSWAAKADLQKFYDYIYTDATIFLGRKKKKIYDALNK